MSKASQLTGRFVAALLFMSALPLMLLLALTLRIWQGHGVLFRQERSGLAGRPFSLVKFRTMRDTRNSDGELLPDDQRTTRIGSFLRKTRLDELPSFWNVVLGELAFIGPRPLLPHTICALGELGRKRGTVPPGLSGWAQVNGNTLLSLEEKVALDLWYIENRRWHTDLVIILATIWVMIAGEKLKLLDIEARHGKS